MSEKTVAARLLERFLVGAVESIGRAGAKAVESLADDAKKALKNKAVEADMLGKVVEGWRKATFGEVIDMSATTEQEKK